MAASVPHRDQKLDDYALEERGALSQDALQEVSFERRVEHAVCCIDLLLRRDLRRGRSLRCGGFLRAGVAAAFGIEFEEGGMGLESFNV